MPVGPDEHPRILFRKSGLPALREKAKTPFGQEALKRMDATASGMGLKYHLTGDAALAEAARKETEALMNGKSYPWYGSGAFTPERPLGGAMIQIALTYDLCHDAWPAGFRQKVRDWMLLRCERAMVEFMWHVSSNHAGHSYAGMGLIGLALWGMQGPAPSAPPPWLVETDLPAAADYQPPEGVPVVTLAAGKSPDRWLVSQGANGMWSVDPCRRTFGFEKERPTVGGACTVDGRELTFTAVKTDDPKGGLRIYELYEARKAALRVAAYTVVKCEEPGLYLFRQPTTGFGRAQVMLSGRAVTDRQVIRLEKGLYPCHLLSHTLVRWHWLRPTLRKVTEKELETWTQNGLPGLRNRIALEDKVHEAEFGIWKATGGQDPRVLRAFRYGRYCMYLHARETVGTGGFQGEVAHYGVDAGDGPNLYYACFPNVFGYPLTPYRDYSVYLPRKVCSTVYPANGAPINQDINGWVGGIEYFAALFPVVPDEYKPAMLWAWNAEAGVTDEASKTKVLTRDGVEAFLHYPLDMKPVHPSKIMPKTWFAPDTGFASFRNGWSGGADIVLQVFAKSHRIGGWNAPNAGTFRLFGLGHAWAVGEGGRQRERQMEPVVHLPQAKGLNLGTMGRVTHTEQQKDGSGVITIDLNDVYATGGGVYSFYGNMRFDTTFKDSGVTGFRSIGVDYSGKGAAPCLLAIVDVVKGGGPKLWLWQTPGDPTESLKVAGNAFTYAQGKTILAGRFISPGDVTIQGGVQTHTMVKAAGHGGGEATVTATTRGINVKGADPEDGLFFFVATLQPGAPPEIRVKGEGLDASVRVGKRTVRFDGRNVVFE